MGDDLAVVRFDVQCCLWGWRESRGAGDVLCHPSTGGDGSKASPSSHSVLSLCCGTMPDRDEKPEFLFASGCPGTDVPPGNGVGGVTGSWHAWCAELGFIAIVCLDSIAALLHLSAGQSGTQDYETSSHEPLPRTPTCTICKCQQLLSPFASSPYGNLVPKVDPHSPCGDSKEREREC